MRTPCAIAAAARACHAAGLCVLPACAAKKYPALPEWEPYQGRPPTDIEVLGWFGSAPALCVVCGHVSGNLEMIDFDARAEKYATWAALVTERSPGLLGRLYLESTQSGGMHAAYRCEAPVDRNLRLCQRLVDAPSDADVEYRGKTYKPRRKRNGPGYEITVTLIETRGQGGLFLCAPSPGYTATQGSLAALPVITSAERGVLLNTAEELDELPHRPEPDPWPATAAVASGVPGGRPGDDFNARGDVGEVLRRHGWTLARRGPRNEYWVRPGKDRGHGATFNGACFYVFTSNAPPFEPDRGYSKFSVYAILEHDGNWSAAGKALHRMGYGKGWRQSPGGMSMDRTHSDVDVAEGAPEAGTANDAVPPPASPDPGPVPTHLLRVPGFVGDVIDYSMANAPYPEPVLAFCGALALQSTLAGRQVRDAQDNRTAIYLLGLANTGTGKDFPRKVNQKILMAAGMVGAFADAMASGEGLEDRLHSQPVMLFQTDELDGLVQAIGTSGAKRDPRFEGIMQTLMKFSTSANAVYPLRVKAGEAGVRTIDQPSLTLFGTAIPDMFYGALSPKMLANGFFARMLILEAGRRSEGQDCNVQDIPAAILKRAKWWAERGARQAGVGPRLVEATEIARAQLSGVRAVANAEYARAEAVSDQAGMALWARAYEKTRRLALIYACSVSHTKPSVTEDAVEWAWSLVRHQTGRMLYKAGMHVSSGDFEGKCKSVLRVLDEWGGTKENGGWMPFWKVSRKLPWTKDDHDRVREALLEQRRIEYTERATGGQPARLYRIAGVSGAASE